MNLPLAAADETILNYGMQGMQIMLYGTIRIEKPAKLVCDEYNLYMCVRGLYRSEKEKGERSHLLPLSGWILKEVRWMLRCCTFNLLYITFKSITRNARLRPDLQNLELNLCTLEER